MQPGRDHPTFNSLRLLLGPSLLAVGECGERRRGEAGRVQMSEGRWQGAGRAAALAPGSADGVPPYVREVPAALRGPAGGPTGP